jgi:MSHA pilin protein MshC
MEPRRGASIAMMTEGLNRGFSLVELVAVILIIGILAVVVVPRFSGNDVYQARGFLDEAASAARYAQRLATTSGCSVQFAVDSGGYSLEYEDPCGSGSFGTFPVPHPARTGSFTANAPASITLSVTGSGTIVFDALGRPSGSNQIIVSVSGYSRSFVIHSDTGYVETL